jgi:hypothetical protein
MRPARPCHHRACPTAPTASSTTRPTPPATHPSGPAAGQLLEPVPAMERGATETQRTRRRHRAGPLSPSRLEHQHPDLVDVGLSPPQVLLPQGQKTPHRRKTAPANRVAVRRLTGAGARSNRGITRPRRLRHAMHAIPEMARSPTLKDAGCGLSYGTYIKARARACRNRPRAPALRGWSGRACVPSPRAGRPPPTTPTPAACRAPEAVLDTRGAAPVERTPTRP